jgi:hypothetical protein
MLMFPRDSRIRGSETPESNSFADDDGTALRSHSAHDEGEALVGTFASAAVPAVPEETTTFSKRRFC